MKTSEFRYLAPKSLAEALELKARHQADSVWLAGGSDLLVRNKQGLTEPGLVISLKHLTKELGRVEISDDHFVLGAMCTLGGLQKNPEIAGGFPGLVKALKSIGAPTLQQAVGTIGGNLCLETRCIYYNQSRFWRSGLAPCFKLGGDVCHPGGEGSERCRSVCSADGAIMLAALDAEVELADQNGAARLKLDEFFTGKGETPLAVGPDQLLTKVHLPKPEKGEGQGYEKIAWRRAVDYPLVSAAAWLRGEGGFIKDARLALGAVYAAPLLMKDAASSIIGKPFDEPGINRAARMAASHAEPFLIENQSAPADWRKKMVRTAALRALTQALAGVEKSS